MTATAMTMRARAALLVAALLLCAAGEPPPPPESVAARIVDGRFDPGDFGWTQGRFDDATPEHAQDYEAIMAWSSSCRSAAIDELRERLAAEGFADPTLDIVFPGALLCRAVAFQPILTDEASFAAFEREAAAVLPLARAFLAATELAVEEAERTSATLADRIRARTIGDQALRRGLGRVRDPQGEFADLSPQGREIVLARLSARLIEYDHDNTEWLKGVVAEQGWPKISEVGEGASGAAWLLAQHADSDPLFQLRALRLMEPLIAEREVSPRNYASLYDRVMLKLAGRQRYGSQFECVDGKLGPQPLEDPAAADRFREEMGMDSLAEYAARIAETARCH